MSWRRCTVLMVIAMAIGACAISACAPDTRDTRDPRESDGTARSPIVVFAASDLRDALAELATRYRATGGDSLVLVFGSTGDLGAQIAAGAPADLFFAANANAIDDLAARGRVVDSTRAVYAIGRLAVVARCAPALRDSLPATCPRVSLTDLTRADIKTVAIADPAHAPYGMAARQALERAGLWPRVQPKLVLGANISQAEQFVSTGNADAGVIALSLVLRTPSRTYTLVDSALHDPLRQTVAAIAGSAHAAGAVRFLQFLRSDTATAILVRYGFTAPDDAVAGTPRR